MNHIKRLELEREEKPRVRFCWECGNKLQGRHFAEVEIIETGNVVVMHKQCAKQYKLVDQTKK